MALQAATGEDAGNDTWLTPPELLRALGTFDLDPCCPPAQIGPKGCRRGAQCQKPNRHRGACWPMRSYCHSVDAEVW